MKLFKKFNFYFLNQTATISILQSRDGNEFHWMYELNGNVYLNKMNTQFDSIEEAEKNARYNAQLKK